MREASVRLGSVEAAVDEKVAGQNLEMALDVTQGLTGERLVNRGFCGTPDALTGLPAPWQSALSNNHPARLTRLWPAFSLSGNESLEYYAPDGREGGIVQTGIKVAAGEKLKVRVWMRTQTNPVKVRAGVRALAVKGPEYARAEWRCDKAYWQLLEADLEMPRQDNEAVFFLTLPEGGHVWVDQVSLRPAAWKGAVRDDLWPVLEKLKPGTLRFPGGGITTAYKWKNGIGPAELRPATVDPQFKFVLDYAFGTDEYLEMCARIGCIPHITVNIASGTPQEAAEWAAYVTDWYRRRGRKLERCYWQIGNEQFGHFELGNCTPEMYCQTLADFVPGIKKACPAARIIGIGQEKSDGFRAGEWHPWFKTVLEKGRKWVDVLAMQWYVNAPAGAVEEGVIQTTRGAQDLLTRLKGCAAACRRVGKHYALTEWNTWREPMHYDGRGFYEPNDAVHGLLIATMLNGFIRLSPGLELANYYNLLNPMGMVISRGPQLVTSGSVEVMRLYRECLPGQRLACRVRGPEVAEKVAALDAAGIRAGRKQWLLLTNRSAREELQVSIEGAGDWSKAEALCGADNEGKALTAVDLEPRGNEVILPPLTVARLQGGNCLENA